MLRDFGAGGNLADRMCPRCSCIGNFSGHGSYTRHLVDGDGERVIEIRRVRCLSCRSTHALIPPDVVPYRVYSAPFIAELARRWAQGESNSRIEREMDLPRTSRRRLLRALLGDLCMLLKVAASKSDIAAKTRDSDAFDLPRRCLRHLPHAISEHVRSPAPARWRRSRPGCFT